MVRDAGGGMFGCGRDDVQVIGLPAGSFQVGLWLPSGACFEVFWLSALTVALVGGQFENDGWFDTTRLWQ